MMQQTEENDFIHWKMNIDKCVAHEYQPVDCSENYFLWLHFLYNNGTEIYMI